MFEDLKMREEGEGVSREERGRSEIEGAGEVRKNGAGGGARLMHKLWSLL